MARVSFDVMDFAAAAGAPLAGRLRAFSCSCARTGPPLGLAFWSMHSRSAAQSRHRRRRSNTATAVPCSGTLRATRRP